MLRILLAVAAFALTLVHGGTAEPLKADSWAMPQVAKFASANGQFRLTVTPAKIGSQLEYFRDRVAEDEGRKAPPAATATAVLERNLSDGKWQEQWRGPLLNRVAPVRVLVSDDGQRMVTFDDWHGVGTGPNVVAIYDGKGALVKVYALADLLPENYIAALSRSVSSIQWSGEHRIDGERGVLVLAIALPRDAGGSERGYLPLEIGLIDGSLSPPSGPAWEVALAAASRVNADDASAEAQRVLYMTEPLAAPNANTEREWHDYLKEAFYRLTPDYLQGPVPVTSVLRSPDAADYKISETWVLEEFADEAEFAGDGITYASLGPPENLVRMLRKASASVPPGSMAKSTVYVAIPASHREAAAAAIARTGARFVWLDPAAAIPQRPERIPGSPEEAAADEIIQRNMTSNAEEAARDAAAHMK